MTGAWCSQQWFACNLVGPLFNSSNHLMLCFLSLIKRLVGRRMWHVLGVPDGPRLKTLEQSNISGDGWRAVEAEAVSCIKR